MQEMAILFCVYVGVALAIILVLGQVLRYFLALKSEPLRRAAWTAGVGAFVAAVCLVFGGLPEFGFIGVLAALPASLLGFWIFFREFSALWVDPDVAETRGITIANEDWIVGLKYIMIALLTAAIAAYFRYLRTH